MAELDLQYKARLAEQLELYTEMKETMKEMVEKRGNLNEEERNLLSVAFKNVVGQKRTSWRIVTSLLTKNSEKAKIDVCSYFKEKIEKELNELCDEIIGLLKNHLLNQEEENAETRVFYHKMHGDYLRYKVEISQGDERDAQSNASKRAYEVAQEIAKELKATHPIRLGLALNFSVFHFEIANDHEKACELAKTAFDEAMEHLDAPSKQQNESYKDSTLIMQLLRDNLTLWRENLDGDQEYDQEGDQDK